MRPLRLPTALGGCRGQRPRRHESVAGGMTTLAHAALAYAARCWAVFPCVPRAKHPMTAGGFQAATTDVEIVRRWWEESPDANPGHVPAQSGHVVIDIDGPEGEAAAQALGLLAEPTLTSLTARGRHLWFTHPGFPVGNVRLAPNVDVRADAGY